jgi:hypothetical protein
MFENSMKAVRECDGLFFDTTKKISRDDVAEEIYECMTALMNTRNQIKQLGIPQFHETNDVKTNRVVTHELVLDGVVFVDTDKNGAKLDEPVPISAALCYLRTGEIHPYYIIRDCRSFNTGQSFLMMKDHHVVPLTAMAKELMFIHKLGS